MSINTTIYVDTVSAEFAAHHKAMELSSDLMGGTQSMITAGVKYIEKGDAETNESYSTRLGRTVLLNTFKRTLHYLKGQVFQKPIVLADGVSTQFEAWSEDVDRSGHNLTSWAADVFEAGLRDGVTFALADYSKVQVRERDGITEYLDESTGEWKPKNQAADKANGWTPYLVHVPASSVIDCWVEGKNGRPAVTMFRYHEVSYEPDGTAFGRQKVERIRVLTAGNWVVWKKTDDGGEYVIETQGPVSIGVVPLAIFMAGEKMGPSTAQPALYDLAELNKRHWAATCGHYELMEFVRRPVWFGRNLGVIVDDRDAQKPLSVGAGKMLSSDSESADLKNVGVDAASVAASQAELDTLKSDMAMYGLQLLQPKTGAITATESDRDASENNSTLMGWALEYQDFLENCLKFVAMWWGESDGPSVKVNTEFSRNVADAYLLELFRAGVISRDTLLKLIKRSGVLPDDFSVEDEAARIAQGMMTNAGPVGVSSLAGVLKF